MLRYPPHTDLPARRSQPPSTVGLARDPPRGFTSLWEICAWQETAQSRQKDTVQKQKRHRGTKMEETLPARQNSSKRHLRQVVRESSGD